MSVSNAIQELLLITGAFSGRSDQVQGPGGNISVKMEDGTMLIKASGYRFEELNSLEGISAVNSKKIAEYFYEVHPIDKETEEQKMLEIIASNTLKKEDGSIYPKPSMETGFHAVLGKYVVHTHSVWTNLINCASNRLDLISQLNMKLPNRMTQLPFISPGFGLSYLVCSHVKACLSEKKMPYDLYFLGNHGIIAQAETAQSVQNILEITDASIRELLGLKNEYPSTGLKQVQENIWQPDSDYISEQLERYNCNAVFFEHVLFPDQTVFFKDQISDRESNFKKINFNQNKVTYRCSHREAKSIHETLTGYLFIHHTLMELKIDPHYIVKSEIDYINNMDMEKYRKGLM